MGRLGMKGGVILSRKVVEKALLGRKIMLADCSISPRLYVAIGLRAV